MAGRRVLLIVGGGIAAFKALETARLLLGRGVAITPLLTKAAQQFVTPLSFTALTRNKTFTELFEPTAEAEMGHIELSRSADLILVAPATADLMAKMATGRADDLASTTLLATDAPILIAPAMNVRMWEHPATGRNLAQLRADGVGVIGPDQGDMACGEYGFGRMVEPSMIADAVMRRLEGGAAPDSSALAGRRALITSGPTREPIDPVRYVSNHSSGKQGVAIAEALAERGVDVTFVTGPAEHAKPFGCRIKNVESARQMRDAAISALEQGAARDIAIFAAAVADWAPLQTAATKLKKTPGQTSMSLELGQNPDILAEIAQWDPAAGRPKLVIGFAAETNDVLENARTKRKRKGCDWLVANDVSTGPAGGVMGGDENEATLITAAGEEQWPRLSKRGTADRLADRISQELAKQA
ncbi:MAG: bifunctional phosphopantothenoylcysteine decarboxylase/phosphopantothenate--cysteine ligase CoaBC [Neomegalonema sp.]|nr:bifunctional phosphopantothenoylcysteine decarboxylase/phosphopantothenate--cysteine ligase CoaBC [Neomegalonema sp.]